jgi:hypothetical protein
MRGLFVVVAVLACALVGAAPAGADWARDALGDQYELGSALPLRDAPWVGTHNSFNSTAEMGTTLSAQDSNQTIQLVDQLDAGVRSLELDVHLFPSAAGGGAPTPVVCHAAELHAGCSAEKPLAVVLDEVAGWLAGHRDQVVLLYLEDHLDTASGYDAAAAVVQQKLGVALYTPTGGGGSCTQLPLDLSRSAVRSAGRQVVIVSSCGQGSGWPAVAFDWSKKHEEKRPIGYQDFPGCGPDFTRAEYEATMIRYFEDSTQVTAGASQVGQATPDDGITPATAAAMARCGVDLLGMDQLERDDPRFAALVWSWAPGQPARSHGCAAQHAGRWYALRCERRLRVACRLSDGRWRVPSRLARYTDAPALCRRARGRFTVPRTGYEAQTLRVAMDRVRAGRAWLRYRSPR